MNDFGTWWVWVVCGLALFGVEILVPGTFFFIFFGVGAFVAGIIDLFFNISSEWEWAIFSIVSIVSMVAFRSRLKAKGAKLSKGFSNSVAGSNARSIDDIAVGGEGNVELQGSNWSSKNVGTSPIAKGDSVVVVSQDGLKLTVKKN